MNTPPKLVLLCAMIDGRKYNAIAGRNSKKPKTVTSYRDLGWIVPPQCTTHRQAAGFNFPRVFGLEFRTQETMSG